MSQLRNQNQIKKRAHQILDDLKAGIHHDKRAINWALSILGEPVNG